MEQLQKNISCFSDEELINQYKNFKDDYTEAALLLLSDEIQRRKITIEQISLLKKDEHIESVIAMDEQNFTLLDHSFHKKDADVLVAILKENKIPCIIDYSSELNTPKKENKNYFSIKVFRDKEKDAYLSIQEHFEVVGDRFQLKTMNISERLKAFSFTQIKIDEKEAKEKVEVIFSDIEKETIIHFGKIIWDKIDSIENDLSRVVFNYDVIEPLIQTLEESSESYYSKAELLAILEILQISTEFESLPLNMEECVDALLSFFVENEE